MARASAIVLGTDFSSGSKLAQARAAELALRHGAALHVVHAVKKIPRALSLRFSSLSDAQVRQSLEEVTEELRRAGVDAHAHLKQGDPVTALTVRARAVAADLVVVSTRGGTALEAMTGSTAERLVASDQHRVLLVRTKAERPYRKVVVAISEESRLREQVEAATFVATKPISLLHVYDEPFAPTLLSQGASTRELNSYQQAARREAEQRVGQLLAKAGLDASRLSFRQGNPAQVLQRFDPESLLVLSRGRSRLRKLLFGSVTRAVVASGSSDVLLV